jgi:type II secretory ATPase GspE/PulE/Tfp pilus assembly ATPase PilB-like protein
LRVLEADEFAHGWPTAYREGQSAAEQVAQGLDEELDLLSLVDQVPQTADLLEQQGDAPIIRLINALLSEAVREQASDVHLETFEHYLSVRMRVDGQLREMLRPRRELATLLVSRIKVMARLDIAEKRVPQDGRMACGWPGMKSMCGSRRCLRRTANGWCCACSTNRPGAWSCSVWACRPTPSLACVNCWANPTAFCW